MPHLADSRTDDRTSPIHKTNAFQNTEEFLIYILHHDYDYITSNGMEKVFVDNCSVFGIQYFTYVFASLYDRYSSLVSLKDELLLIVDEVILDKIYRYLAVYMVEFYVRESRFGHIRSIFDVVRHCLVTESLNMMKFLYEKCDTSIETRSLLEKIHYNISPEHLTQFEICELYSQFCAWDKFRDFLTSNYQWCYHSLHQNERSIMHRVMNISFSRDTFDDIHTHLVKTSTSFFDKSHGPYLNWITSILEQNRFRQTDNWIVGMRTQVPVSSMSEHVLINTLLCILQHDEWTQEKSQEKSQDSSSDFTYEEFSTCIQSGLSTHTCTAPYLLFLKCEAFDIIAFPLIKKLDYILKQHVEIDTVLDMTLLEYSTNENASLSTISNSLVDMFRNKIAHLSNSMEIRNIIIPAVLKIIHRYCYSFLFQMSILMEDNTFPSNTYIVLSYINNILFVLNYCKKSMAYYYRPSEAEFKSISDMCIGLIGNTKIPLHYKTEILKYISLHNTIRDSTQSQIRNLCTFYSKIEKEGGYEDEIREQQDLISDVLYQYVIQSKHPMWICDVENPTLFLFSIVNNLSKRMESYRENYEYARSKFYSGNVLSIPQVMSQEKYSKNIQKDIAKTIELLNILNHCNTFAPFRKLLMNNVVSDKLCEIMLYIIRYSIKRFSRTYSIVSRALECLEFMTTFETFGKNFVRICGTSQPKPLVELRDMLVLSVFKKNQRSEMCDTIDKILLSLQVYKESVVDYDTIADILLDPLMHTMIEDPVVLPGSRTLMDRTHILRYLQTKNENPFTREKLTVESLNEFNETQEAKDLIIPFQKAYNEYMQKKHRDKSATDAVESKKDDNVSEESDVDEDRGTEESEETNECKLPENVCESKCSSNDVDEEEKVQESHTEIVEEKVDEEKQNIK